MLGPPLRIELPIQQHQVPINAVTVQMEFAMKHFSSNATSGSSHGEDQGRGKLRTWLNRV
jgi:hypothetical protein